MKGEVWVHRAQSGYKMVLEGLDRSFRRISTVISCRCELIRDAVGVHFILHHARDFIVQKLETGVKASALEAIK